MIEVAQQQSYGSIEMCILLLLLLLFFIPRKNEGGKKLRKVERVLKWKTSPGGPQRENRRALKRWIATELLLLLFFYYIIIIIKFIIIQYNIIYLHDDA